MGKNEQILDNFDSFWFARIPRFALLKDSINIAKMCSKH